MMQNWQYQHQQQQQNANGGFEADLYDGSFYRQARRQSRAVPQQQQQQQHRHQLSAAPSRFRAGLSTAMWGGFRGAYGAESAAVVKNSTAKSPGGAANDSGTAAAESNDNADEPGRLRTCASRFGSIMLSQLGTFVIVICYVVMGGCLFQYLEVENEISSCQTKYDKYLSKRNEAVDRMYNMAQNGNATVAKSAIFDEISDFAKEMFTLGTDPRLNCSTMGQGDNIPYWNFANSAYFCVTIITTIGYGHITPVTSWGQIVCMIYAILGIPLMLLFLTKIGEPTAILFKSFYLNICCCKCFVKRKRAEERAAEQQKRQQQQQQQQEQQTCWTTAEDGSNKLPPAKVKDLVVVEEDPDDDDDEDCEEDIVNIPISVTILLLILYILLGAAVFRVWEKWTLVEGTYFSFVTLSTIGFGDYVPGKDGPFNSSAVITELLVGALYCFFGLTVLSMCINLIQDEISAKFHWIGLKLGMVKRAELQASDDSDDDSNSSSSGSGSSSDGGDSSSGEASSDNEAADGELDAGGARAQKQQHRRKQQQQQLKPPPPLSPLPQPSFRSPRPGGGGLSGRHILYDDNVRNDGSFA